MSRRAAHDVLAGIRQMMSTRHWACYDITDSPEANWRAYLAYHPQGQEIVGPGVYRFEVRRLAAWDPNMQDRRVDFVVRRVDGTDVRLHPGSQKDTVPIFGVLTDWLQEEKTPPPAPAPAASRGLINRDHHGWHCMAQSDVLGRVQMQRWLRQRLDMWEARVLATYTYLNP